MLATTAPSGNVGRHVVQDLVRAGVRPRVLAHRPESLDPSLADHVDLRVVDLTDAGAVRAALDGVEALFLTVPALPADDPVAAYAHVGGVVADAVRAQRVARVVLQSSVGAELRHGAGEIDGLARVEEHLDAAGTSVLHLRCGFFSTNLLLQLDDLRAGEVPVLVPTDHRMPWVAPVDVARVAVGWLLRADWSGRHVRAVHGPEDLSWDDALAAVRAATGHAARAVRVPETAVRAGLADAGMTDAQVDALVGMSTGVGVGFVPEQQRDATTTTPTTLGAWAHEALRPLLAG